ncbi:MAG TPA: helix-turn-helix domain-containing protein [Micropepsaceae bacterium]|jgi:CRP/FNR family nitrogen fixation transcriptional regulator|nr:helix-turn-helix domain-containing protein [Micropepsaceae bacterium]
MRDFDEAPRTARAVHLRQNGSAGTPVTFSDDIEALQRIATKVRYPKNRTIFNDGDEADFTYRIVSGVVRLCKHTVQGRRLVTHFLLPGDYFGFMQLNAYSFTAEAVTDVVAVCYAQRIIETLSENDSEVRKKFRALFMSQVIGTQEHLLLLGCLSAEERLAAFLLWLSERMGSNAFVEVPMGRQDIADYLGLTVETVCRALSKLKRAGIVDLPRSNQMVQNLDSLRAFRGSHGGPTASSGISDGSGISGSLADLECPVDLAQCLTH